MKEIKINFDKSGLNLKDILAYSDKVEKISNKMEIFETEGSAFLGWKDLPNNINNEELNKMEKEAKRLQKEGIEILVVIGIGGSYLGVKAGMDFVLGEYPDKNSQKMELVFAGDSISSTSLAQN